jgi:hypothetical protein
MAGAFQSNAFQNNAFQTTFSPMPPPEPPVPGTSGTYNFFPTNGSIVLSAYERIQIRAPELRQEHMLSAYKEFNFLLAEYSNKQPNLWKVVRIQTVLVAGQATYPLLANTVMILDASVVLNFGTQYESRRYITPISRTEYLSYANQQSPGPPTVYWFDRQEAPTVTFYLVPDANGPYTFDYFSCIQMQDSNLSGGEIPDVPYRWIDALVAGLAYRLSRIYAPTLEPMRKTDATDAWAIAATQDTENVPTVLAPGLANYYRR